MSHETKSGVYSYEFVGEEFNNLKKHTKTDIVYPDVKEATTQIVGMPLAYSGRLQDVYSETHLIPGLKQRDYIYYGMTAALDTGLISYNYMERLYCMKISNMNSRFLYDEDEYDWSDSYNSYDSNDASVNSLSLRFKTWKDGNLDLYFYIHDGRGNDTKLKSVAFKDVFSVKTVHCSTVGSGNSAYELYTVDDDSFVAKWFYINIDLFCWDIRLYPSFYSVGIKEYDDSGTSITTTEQITYSYMTNYSEVGESGSGTDSSTQKNGYNNGGSNTNTVTQTTTRTITQSSDDLGSFTVNYEDDILYADPDGSSTQMNTPVMIYHTGVVDVVVVPKYIP